MSFKHSRDNAKKLIAINLAAWTAGAVFLYKNCNPAEEPLVTRVIEAPASAPAPAPSKTSSAATSGSGSCSEYHCEFVLQNDSKFPRSERMFLLAQMGVVFSDARKKLEDLECSGGQPVLKLGDRETDALLRAIGRLNEAVARKYGYEPIPVSGPDARERFRSLNRWLKRGEDQPIDDSSLSRLDLMMVEAVME